MEQSTSFDRAASFYDTTRQFPPHISKAVTATLLNTISPLPDAVFLEVGAGTGRIGFPFIEQGYHLVGIDLARAMLAKFKERLHAEHNAGLIQADAIRLPFADGTFDVLLAVHVFHLIPNWQVALEEIARVLRPQGAFCFVGRRWRDPNSLNVQVRSQFRQQAAELGIDTRPVGIQGNDQLLAQLHRLHLQEEIRTEPIQWTEPVSVRQLLERLAQHVYEDTWRMTTSQHESLVTRLTDWAISTYGSLDVAEEQHNSFSWHIARFE